MGRPSLGVPADARQLDKLNEKREDSLLHYIVIPMAKLSTDTERKKVLTGCAKQMQYNNEFN